MVRHEGPGVNDHIAFSAWFNQTIDKIILIVRISEDLGTFDPSGHDMVEGSGGNRACLGISESYHFL
jgi:hypothetical protein